MKIKKNFIVVIILTTTAGAIAVLSRVAPAAIDRPKVPTESKTPTILFTDTPPVSPTYEGCSYVWASHNSPELTQRIDTTVRKLDPAATANVEFFGEDCVYADGSGTFGAMETDFYIYLTVKDLAGEENFGNWMAQVLPQITQIPRKEIKGNYGFAEFWFEKSESEKVVVRVPLQKYIDEVQGKTGIDLFRLYLEVP